MGKSKSISNIKLKYLVLVTIDISYLQLAYIRSVLAQKLLVYVEVANSFLISCNNQDRDALADELTTVGINYMLIFANTKTGARALVNGLSDQDFSKIKEIVE